MPIYGCTAVETQKWLAFNPVHYTQSCIRLAKQSASMHLSSEYQQGWKKSDGQWGILAQWAQHNRRSKAAVVVEEQLKAHRKILAPEQREIWSFLQQCLNMTKPFALTPTFGTPSGYNLIWGGFTEFRLHTWQPHCCTTIESSEIHCSRTVNAWNKLCPELYMDTKSKFWKILMKIRSVDGTNRELGQ